MWHHYLFRSADQRTKELTRSVLAEMVPQYTRTYSRTHSIKCENPGVDHSPLPLPPCRRLQSGVPIFVEHWGDKLQFHPNFALFSTMGRINLDHDFFQVSKLSEDQKKKSSPKKEHLFFLNSNGDLRSNAHQSQIVGGDADVDHT